MSKEKVLYYPVVVHYEANTWVSRNRDESDQWDNDDTVTDTTVLGVETEKEQRERQIYADIAVPFEVISGKDYYLVYVTYSTGDSFHHEEGSVNFIELFETREKAEQLAKLIEEHYSFSDNEQRWNEQKKKPPKGYSQFNLIYHNEEGREMSLHVGWTGYFERLTSVTVEKVRHYSASNKGRIRYRY